MFQEKTINHSLIGLMRESGWTMRGIASVVILTFGSLMTLPAEAAIQQEVKQIQQKKAAEGSGSRFSGDMKSIKEHLAATLKTPQGTSLMDMRRQLNTDATLVTASDREIQDGFASTRAMIKDKHLPDVIMQRELAAEKHYNTEMGALKQGLSDIVAENDDAKVQARSKDVLDRLSQFQDERKPQKFDPKEMPNRSLKPDLTRKPHLTKKAFAEAGYISNPRLMVATTAPNFDYSQVPGANDPAFIEATTEVTLSPAIQAQAAALNYNPVQIYNWVRNNIQWQPTWGAVQDADLTLSSQRGNAFDISSLLIALLRASNIPARYVQGTINVPEAKFRNWVGGFQDINAAVNYASAGGIPITSLVAGGKITTIQMEHIWVEAAIDYIPSRGAVNKSADTWVPMDASYKQNTFQQGLDPIAISGTNTSSLVQQFIASGTVDTADGYISGLNPTVLQNAQQTGQSAVQNYVTQNLPNATVGQVIGGSTIVPRAVTVLSASLPYSVKVRGASYGVLPNQLEQSITFSLGNDALGEMLNPVTFAWPKLNNQQVVVSFAPASAADKQALLSLIPSGQITDISQLPASVPAYLINVLPELKVNGLVVATGSEMMLGQELTFTFTPNFAGRYSVPNTYNVIAGSYLDVAVIAGNVGQQNLVNLETRIQQTQAALQSQDPSQLSSLTSENFLGDLFQAGLLGYYTQYTAFSYAAGLRQGGYHYLAGGIGTFGYEPQVVYTFGVPQNIYGGAAVMNVPIINVIGHDGSDQSQLVNFALQIGIMSSAFEAQVPQQMFTTPTQPVQSISAAEALNIASASGQRIYCITQANEANVLPLIHHDSLVMQEITDALSAGKDVITHTDDVSVANWTGAGYVMFDPQTGDGAYKIGGGQNGAFIFGIIVGTLLFMGVFLAIIGIAAIASPIGIALLALGIGLVLESILLIRYFSPKFQSSNVASCFTAGLTLAVWLLGFLAPFMGLVTKGLTLGLGFAASLITGATQFTGAAKPQDCISGG